MNLRDVISNLLSELSERVGEKLMLNDDGVCGMAFGNDGQLFLEVLDDDNAIMLYSPVALQPTDHESAFYAHLLRLNLFGQLTRGCILGLDTVQQEVVLSWRQEADELSFTGFENMLGHFMEAAEAVRTEIESRSHAAPDFAAGNEGPATPQMTRV